MPYEQQSFSNQGAAARPAAQNGQREKVYFETNMPQQLTLEFNPPNEPRAGRFGDQFMYFLSENRIMWVDPPLHEAIVNANAQAGSEIVICKREQRNGQRKHITWEVENVAEQIAQSERVSGNLMASAMEQAIEAAHNATVLAAERYDWLFNFNEGDIRALAATIYINATGGSKK